jgi:hypothetical protein
MTQDEMIALAKQAGFAEPERIISTDTVRCVPDLAYFAELIAEREREACAKIADEWAVGWPHPSEVIAERIRVRGQA